VLGTADALVCLLPTARRLGLGEIINLLSPALGWIKVYVEADGPVIAPYAGNRQVDQLEARRKWED